MSLVVFSHFITFGLGWIAGCIYLYFFGVRRINAELRRRAPLVWPSVEFRNGDMKKTVNATRPDLIERTRQ